MPRPTGASFRLSPKVLELGYSYLSSLGLPEIAQPFLRNVVQQTGESSSMSVLDGDDIMYVARVPTSQIMTVGITVGTRFPAYATSMGRVLLAGLDDEELTRRLQRITLVRFTKRTISSVDDLYDEVLTVRKQGYSLVDQELEEGLRSIAAPVRNRAGCTVAAVNVSSHAARMSKERARKEFLPPLLEAVRDIGAGIT